MKLDTKKKRVAFIAKAISHYLILYGDEKLIPDGLFNTLFPYINISELPDRHLLSNPRIRNKIDWNSLKKTQLLRLLCRDIDILEHIDMSKYNFTIMELYPVFLMYPELIRQFDIDFDSLTSIEVIKLLECDNSLVDDVNLQAYKFNKNQTSYIIKNFGNNQEIMSKVNLSSLDSFNLKNLLKRTGPKYIDQIDLSSLNVTQWFDVLVSQPDLIEHCNLLLFEKNDCYQLVKLVELFPQLDYMIEENIDKISGLGWERLLISNLEKYREICKWEVLSKKNWDNIVLRHPELDGIKRQYTL